MNIIRHIVGNCHVSMTNKQVIRFVISRLKDKEQTFWSLSKEDRRNFIKTCIQEHQENVQLYVDVMNGNI